METAWSDLRLSLRQLAKSPVFTALAVFMLALGIGANTAIFSLLEAVVLKPLPYRDPDRLVVVHNLRDGETFGPHSSSWPDFEDWRAERRTLAQSALFSYWTFNLTGREVPLRIVGGRVTGDFFATLGVEPALGRTLTPDDDLPGTPEAVVLSYRTYQSLFGGEEGILGQELILNGQAHSVVGVMPEEFRFPGEDVEIWGAVRDHMTGLQRHNRFMFVVARLAPGVVLSQAQQALDLVTARLQKEYPESNQGYRARLVSAHETQVGKAEPALLLLQVAVGFVLLIACINVSNLVLTRAVARRRDAATRVALGAGWTRLARAYLAESLWIGLAGGALGVLLAMVGLRFLLRLHPGGVPRLDRVGIDAGVLVFALTISVAAGLVLGLVPILDAWRGGLARALGAGGRGELEGSRRSRLRDSLVTLEVALSLVLLAGGGLLMRSFLKLTSVDPGFRAERVLTMSVFLTPPGYRTIPERWQYAPMRQITFPWLRWFTFVLGASGDAQALAAVSRDALLRIDPDQPVFQIRTLEGAIASSVAERRFHLVLVQAFAAVALVLAALGVYGVVAHTVSERTREIGLRVSLGARRRDILGLFVGRGMRFSLAGILAGLAAAAGVTRFMASMLFGIGPVDLWTFGTVALVLFSVALAASLVPARRAAGFDPAKALRHE